MSRPVMSDEQKQAICEEVFAYLKQGLSAKEAADRALKDAGYRGGRSNTAGEAEREARGAVRHIRG